MLSLLSDDGVVLLGYQIRSPEAHQLFWEMCDRVFQIQKVPHNHLHPDYAYDDADVFVLRKKKNLLEAWNGFKVEVSQSPHFCQAVSYIERSSPDSNGISSPY